MRVVSLLVTLSFLISVSAIAEPVRLLFSQTGSHATNGVSSLCVSVDTNGPPAASELYLVNSEEEGVPWHHGETLRGTFSLTRGLPPARLLFFLKTRDGYWFQTLLPERFSAGTNRWSVPFSSKAKEVWRPVGHHLVWNHRARLDPAFVGVRLFFEPSAKPARGSCSFLDASLLPTPDDPSELPVPMGLHLSSSTPACYSLLETRFLLPDRYDDPFDPDEIDVMADIACPDGQTVTIPAFHTQDFYAEENASGGRLVPDGAPGWRLRYAPVLPGRHSLRIRATDCHGSATSAPVAFVAQPSDGPAYVTVSRRNRFRFQAGTNDFFPVGHNIRSPSDSRFDTQYPWHPRLPKNYLAYKRYFSRMGEAGENMAEVWMCQWSLGLEWSPVSPGYHGVGDYHLGNAWELDRVLEFARQNDIRVNLVLNNHGRASLFSDKEWESNPYNESQGGFLPRKDPIQFFIDPRAIQLQKRLYRYIAARWGWSPSIFAFELWSELDLCGNGKERVKANDDPDVIAWHREIANYIRSLDPNKHLISTHVSGNYHNAKPAILRIPELDHCCIDAYHNESDPLYIIELLMQTADFYRSFDKPVLVTEFGGSSNGAGLSHISTELHAALWSSVASTLAGTPFLWWWGLIDEQNLYPEFTPVREFMRNAPYQDPALEPATLLMTPSNAKCNDDSQGKHRPLYQVTAASGTNLIAWIYQPERLRERYQGTLPTNVVPQERDIEWGPVSNGIYRVVQCDTITGEPVKIQDHRTVNTLERVTLEVNGKTIEKDVPTGEGVLRFSLKPFATDCAIKIFPR